MEPMKTLGMFHTPESMNELDEWLARVNDPMVTTGAMMMYNLMATIHNNMINEQEKQS